MRILDRYLIKEILPPFLLALLMFTFLLDVKPMLEQARALLAHDVDISTVAFLVIILLPQAIGLTLPMALLPGILMALGRLSGDREAVALLACGVSPARLLRPVLLVALAAGAVDLYVLVRLVPDSNQRFREETFKLLAQQSEGNIKPGLFYTGFPGKMVYVREELPGGGWSGVLLADTSQPSRPILTFAENGHLDLDPVRREVAIVLPGESLRYLPGETEGIYDVARVQDLRVAISAESVFGGGSTLSRGIREMSITGLRQSEAEKVAAGVSPHPEIIQRHQMFSFPIACVVFALLGVSLGVHTRKDGKLGGFALGIGGLFAYYGIMMLFENLTKGGDFPAHWARWIPNIVLGAAAVVAIRWRMRSVGHEMALPIPAWLTRPRRRPGTPTATSAPAPPVLVIRIPDFHLPRPRLLDLYISRRYLSVAALSFFGLLGLYYIGTFIDKSERLFKGQADIWMLVQFFAYSTPQFIAHVAPMAVLVAVLATIGGLARTSELTVMRACGVSLYRVAVPLLLLSLGWSIGLFFLNDRVIAKANQRAETLEDVIKGAPPRIATSLAGASWLIDRTGRIYFYNAFDSNRQTLYGLSVFELRPRPFQLTSHSSVGRATFTKGQWWTAQGWTQHFAGAGKSSRQNFGARTLPIAAPSEFAGMQNRQAELMTFGELRQNINQLAASGFSLSSAQVTMHERIAFPFVAVVMTLLGVPFGISTGRRGALYGIGLAIVLGASYWLFDTFFLAAGQADLLPAVLAAWAANLLFFAGAAYLTLTVRT